MGWDKAISGGLGIVSSLAGAAINRSSAKRVQERQEAYTERQMQNAHQWEVEDLKKAGLNPVLSANSAHAIGGAGTTSESGSGVDFSSNMANISSAKNSDSAAKLNDATTTKTKIEAGVIEPTAKKNIEKMDSEIEQNEKKIELMESQKELNKAQKKYTNERARGYSESSSESTSTSTDFGGGLSLTKGISGKAGHSSAKTISKSKTW